MQRDCGATECRKTEERGGGQLAAGCVCAAVRERAIDCCRQSCESDETPHRRLRDRGGRGHVCAS